MTKPEKPGLYLCTCRGLHNTYTKIWARWNGRYFEKGEGERVFGVVMWEDEPWEVWKVEEVKS